MGKVIKREDVSNALEAADVYDTEEAIVTSYSGRFYAKDGFGIKLPAMSHAFAFFAALGGEGGIADQWAEGTDDTYLTSTKAYNLACAGRTDNLGSDILLYFPGWTLAD